jgi:hypothetical protein
MVVHAIGACLLAKLMRLDRDSGPDTEWLLHGPSDPEIVEDSVIDDRPWLLAAE